jgi:hypothetical protein
MSSGNNGAMPSDNGYLPVTTALTTGGLSSTWYALGLQIDLGTRGGLAQKSSFACNLLLAWSPNASGVSAGLMLQLPGSGNSVLLQEVLSLSADWFQLVTYQKDNATAFMLLFKNLALKVLSLKLPPGGHTDVYLFGNPDVINQPGSIGWYAAYQKDKSILKQLE